MNLLTLFLLRLSAGLALGMTIASPRQTSSGYFRNQSYVLLGLCALAALIARTASPASFLWALAAAVICYVGAVCWLYERASWGMATLFLASATAMTGATAVTHLHSNDATAPTSNATDSSDAAFDDAEVTLAQPAETAAAPGENSLEIRWLRHAQAICSSLLLGVTMAAMLLGHWYLNAPGMALGPLERLITVLFLAVGMQGAVCGAGLILELTRTAHATSPQWWMMVALRWLFGLVGVAALTAMARQTLRIPNTQSATGILYVAVIGTFGGEIVSMLLSTQAIYPL